MRTKVFYVINTRSYAYDCEYCIHVFCCAISNVVIQDISYWHLIFIIEVNGF